MPRGALQSEPGWPRLIEAIPAAMIVVDASGRITLLNSQAEQLFGYHPGELVGQQIERLLPARYRSDHPQFRVMFHSDARPRPMGAGRELYALARDGREIPVEIGLNPIETADGPMVLAAIVDISERRRFERQRELLIRELNHRVKNILAVVHAIASQTRRAVDSLDEFSARFEGRLAALAAAHDLLVRRNWSDVEISALLESVLHAAAVPGRIDLAGEAVEIPAPAAISLTLLVHELATNAIKYGALSDRDGRIEIRWQRTGDTPRLRLQWIEHCGHPVQPPASPGFGTRLIDQVTSELGATVEREWRAEGLVLRLEMPLPVAEFSGSP